MLSLLQADRVNALGEVGVSRGSRILCRVADPLNKEKGRRRQTVVTVCHAKLPTSSSGQV